LAVYLFVVSLITRGILLATKPEPLHYVLATLAPVTILLDTLAISYVID
jgi:hypothetical protein